jgi:hydroxyethylthiazole kinase-like sugar kinase family protein
MELTEVLQFIQAVAIPAVLAAVGVGIKVYVQLNKEKLSAEQEHRLGNLSEMTVVAAEELGKREGWSSQEKYNHVRDILETALPLVETDVVNAGIHAAIVSVGLGKSDKEQ